MITTQPPPPEGRIPPAGDTLFPPLRAHCDPGENVVDCATRLFGAGVLVCAPQSAEDLSRQTTPPRVKVGEVAAHRSDPGYTVLASATDVVAIAVKGAYPTYARMHPATARAAMCLGWMTELWLVQRANWTRRVVVRWASLCGWTVSVGSADPDPRKTPHLTGAAFKEAMREIKGAQR